MAVRRIVTTVGLVSPSGATVATLAASDVVVTLDEGTAPYVSARVTVAMPSALQFAMMKPGAGYYLSIALYPATSAAAPTLLKITDRNRGTIGNVDLQAQSAELDLMGYRPPAVDRSNWGRQADVMAMVGAVLTAALGSYTRYVYPDGFGQDVGVRTYPTFLNASNLIANGGFEYSTNSWVTVTTNIARDTSVRHTGAASMKTTPIGSATDTYTQATVNLSPGTTYTLSGWLYQSTTTAAAHARARTLSVIASMGGAPYILAMSPQAANVSGRWVQTSVTFTTPPILDPQGTNVRLYNGSGSGAANTVWWDDVLLVEGNGVDTDGVSLVPFFDGDTPGTAQYTYSWDGTPGLSSSKRTAVVGRDPASLTWSPGQTAWEFLQPILQASGLRLWSTGYAASSGSVKPLVSYATNTFGIDRTAPRVQDNLNLFDLSQLDSWSAEFADGTPMYADQVIIRYSWTDALGAAQEAYDVYPATGRKSHYIDQPDTPYPGPGRAQGIYDRISARATIFQGTTWLDRDLEPGRQLSITSATAAGGSVVGYIDAVTHDAGRATTEFRTKRTIAYTSSSWFAATGSWASQTGSWAADQ